MSQGDQRLVINLRERILSADFATLQSLAAAEKAGLLRSFYDDTLGDWYTAGGAQTPVTSSSPSLVGDVFGGVMVQPDNANYYTVTPGTLGVLEPSGLGTYDNPYRVIVDPGVQAAGALPFTANAAGQPRWDVVECQPVDQLLAQEMRYIFNPSTGIATPTLVDKLRAGRLTYRVRTGVAGSGFPGLAAGWLPLAVACVPAGSTSLLTSDVWDVRPLVRDRVRPHPVDAATGVGYCPIQAAEYRLSFTGGTYWTGTSESEFNGYLAGGTLIRSTPSTLAQFGLSSAAGGAAAFVNAGLADNQSTTYSLATDAPASLVAVFPAGLPRWQRYSQSPVGSGRVPNGPRGMLVMTTITPKPTGVVLAVPLPSAAQFGATTHPACLLAQTQASSGTVLRRASAAQAIHYWTDGATMVPSSVNVGTLYFDTSLVSGALWPACATRVLIQFRLRANNVGGSASVTVGVSTYDLGTTDNLALVDFFNVTVGTSSAEQFIFSRWIPVIAKTRPNNTAFPANLRIQVDLSTAGNADAVLSNIRCLAWTSSRS